ncbi:prepilin peptidase [Kitasatospora sp. NPDC057223]|uniref:prepilin peptidase n=1 Tax=Kitasatospora sp. NPDC057223 TaxID=3346055 RepID=UPI0036338415
MVGLVVGAVAALAVAPVLRGAVVRYAVPDGEPLCTACPACGRALRALAPTGRCPGCGGRLGPWAGLVELAAVAAAVTLLWAAGPPQVPVLLWTGCLGVVLAFVDGRVRRLPDPLTLRLGLGAALLLAVAAFADGRPGVLLRCLGVALAAWALFELPAWFGLMGLGDGKLALALGALLGLYGWGTAFGALFLASATAALWGTGRALAALVRRRPVRGLELPFGPFMLLGTLLAIALAQV